MQTDDDKNEIVTIENPIGDLLELDNWDREILKYILEFPGISHTKIGKALGKPKRWVTNRANKPSFQLAVQRLNSTTDDLMKKAAKKAASRLLDLIDHPNPMIALGAVKVALTRFLSKEVEPTEEAVVTYETTIQPDGNLLQNVIRKELEDEANAS